MDTQTLIYIFVGLSFALYIGIAIWSRAGTTIADLQCFAATAAVGHAG